jgi:hypothetical protein
MTKLVVSTLVLLSFTICSQASQSLVAADKLIINLNKSLQKQKDQTAVPVIFPKILPASAELKQYYLHLNTVEQADEEFSLSIDATADCNGAHACNLGYLTAKQLANPEIYYDMNNQEITTSIELARGLKGYFTPGHAMGSFFPAMLSWRDDSILYTLSWNLAMPDEQITLVEMANSAILSRL